MLWLRKTRLRTRSALSFGLIGFIVLLLGLFALERIERMNHETQEISEHWVPSLLKLKQLNDTMQRIGIMTFRMVVLRNPELLAANEQGIATQATAAHALIEEIATQLRSQAEHQAYENYLSAMRIFDQEREKVIRLGSQGKAEEAVRLLNGPIDGYALTFAKATDVLNSLYIEGYEQAAERARVSRRSALIGILVALFCAALATAMLAFFYSRSLILPLNATLVVAKRVAEGDLTDMTPVQEQDEPAQVLNALIAMQMRLRQMMGGISQASLQLDAASSELQDVTERTATGLQRQHAEIEQAATAVNEMTTAVDHVAQNASQTAEACRHSDEASKMGQTEVASTLNVITELRAELAASYRHVEELIASLGGISHVLEVIRGIAEQTNLLALNAAIEAARAGQAGHGFAVVADEVRALAHRTKVSTGEIEAMVSSIHQSSQRTTASMQRSLDYADTSLRCAQRSGQALAHIAGSAATITDRNLIIAGASEQQAQVAREVDCNLVSIRDLSLQTAKDAKAVHLAGDQLASLASQLSRLVSVFRF